MAKRKTYHVTPDDGKWQVKASNAKRASSVHGTKREAMKQAKKYAKKRKPSQVVEHGQDGIIQGESTYGQDPEKYKG